ncbi:MULTISPECIES: hypothetical protein [Roseobacteraceae]|uniref:Uncharacterized protein n=1 Tax=Pseudosulfitobacter pseudonitzschiae TaxID=1402135 RepID=A0A221K567_9RHOB|nr:MULTISPECIES: hypothetical protein [Roseobacteraceae]ASM74129.1 hypothetical protein SULPSESMR1_03354 [Pseudosulfitobacter pseudonitzschiae]
MIPRNLSASLIAALVALPAFAEDALVAMPAPAERPYPYEILGLQPGDPLDDVLAVYAERSDAAPTSESEVLRVQSPDGAVFEFSYQLFTRIGDVGINGRLAGTAQDQVTATLSSDVMKQRPMAIHRSIRQPSDQLPEPLALRAQIEETYGPPSRVEVNGREMVLTYAWSTDGFIADLDALGAVTHEETSSSGSTMTTEYELCGSARHYLNNVEYRFEYPRDALIKPGCLATFTVSYRGDPGMTSINFSLVDYELGRQHMAELDRQIVEALTGKTVEASDMDL